jgi:hypothetical protein
MISEQNFSYNRSVDEIELMLNSALDKRREWELFFHRAKRMNHRDGMKDAARNCKALEGVVKTLKWTLGEQGIENPLE